jgi:hypothetical protein
VKGDALNTGMAPDSFDTALLFGVIPAPMVPLASLVREMRRVLKPEGALSV